MRAKFPSQVTLDPDEIARINRVQIARAFGTAPAQVDTWPAGDVDDILEVLHSEEVLRGK